MRDYSDQYARYGRLLNSDIALYGMFISVALVMSYVESIIPVAIPIPGVKLGLANIVIVWTLYVLDWKAAAAISLLRVAIAGLLFGNLYSIVFSAVGATLSLVVMALLKRTKKFKVLGVSIAGGVAHNVGQIAVAMLVLENARLISYLPILMFSGVIAGVAIGILAGLLYSKLRLRPLATTKETKADASNRKNENKNISQEQETISLQENADEQDDA